MSDAWITKALDTSYPLQSTPTELALIHKLLDITEGYQDGTSILAATFDLLVAAEYYSTVAHIGWLYCPFPEPLLLYPYTNTCPRCILEGDFVFHKANKPKSGSIGAVSARLLGLFIKELLHRRGLSIEVRKGSEPIDAIFIDETTTPTTLFFVEIKASPLLTLPLVVPTQQMTTEYETPYSAHRDSDFPLLFGSNIHIYVPKLAKDTTHWIGQSYILGNKQHTTDKAWAYQGLIALLENDLFVEDYLYFWQAAFTSYQKREPHPTYWFTNGCGQPNPRPDTWPRRAGTGYESVSDGKTSVGMDRTDDIKKGTYQVLKLGAAGNPSTHYSYKVGMVSNIHAVRHFDGYLTSLQDIIWTRESTGLARKAEHLSPDTQFFNLFDGIITLTDTLARDAWVERVFRFGKLQ